MERIQEALSKIENAKKEGKKSISLNNLGLTKIPIELLGLKDQLVSIDLMQNQLNELPTFIKEFSILKRLHLSDNLFTNFPLEVLLLKRLDHLCFRNNKIKVIPEETEQLENLIDLQFDNNLIEILPVTLSNIDVLLNLSLEGNPIKDPPPEIIKKGAAGIFKYLYEKEKGKIFKFPIAKEVKTAFKQYLVNFNDYVSASKGKKIDFEVRNFDEGLEIEIKVKNDSELPIIESYLHEYMSFIKSNIDDLKINYEVQVSESKDELIKLQVKSEVQHLKMKLEFSEFKVKHLEKEVDRMNNLLVLSTQNPQPLLINVAQNNLTQNNSYLPNEVDNEIQGLKMLFEKILESHLLDDKNSELALELQSEISDLQNRGSLEEVKKSNLWHKIKSFTSGILEKSEKLGKAFKGAKDTIEGVNLIGKKLEFLLELLQNIGG